MPDFMTDRDVVTRILGHIDNGTTDRGDDVWQEPVAHYRDPDRFARERELMRRTPTPFCPSIALEKTGDYVARAAAGTPLIVVRGREGQARAFINACRHRGAELVSGAGCAGAFVCPYHGWSYGLDGALLGIPHADGFPDIDRLESGLVEVTTLEQNGIVFVIQQPPCDDHGKARESLHGLPHVLKDDQILFAQSETIIEANWKLHLESFLEGYHIKPAHKTTFFPFGYDNMNVIETHNDHARVTFPFQRIEAFRGTNAADPDVSQALTYVTHIFPNVILAELSHHRTLGIIEPISVERSKIISYHMTKSTDAAGRDTAVADAKRDIAFVNETGQTEDIALVEGIQRSLHTQANDVFTFGHFEPAIVHFHKTMARKLDATA